MIARDEIRTGSLTATTSDPVTLNMPGMGTASVQISGTFVGTVTYEASNDGTTYTAIKGALIGAGTKASSDTTANLRVFPVAGLRYFRVRCSAYTSGTIVVTINGSVAALPENAQYT